MSRETGSGSSLTRKIRGSEATMFHRSRIWFNSTCGATAETDVSTVTLTYATASNCQTTEDFTGGKVIAMGRIRVQGVEEEKPAPPKPWSRERVPVLPRFKRLGLSSFRPMQQRARDGLR